MKLLLKQLLPFFILIFVVLGCTKLGRQAQGKLEDQEKVIKILNEQFDLSYRNRTARQVTQGIKFDCQFRFFERLRNDKITLFVRFCESTSFATQERKLADVLTPENLALIKSAGFEQVVLYDRTEDEFIDSAIIK